jgi:hypothetical protein
MQEKPFNRKGADGDVTEFHPLPFAPKPGGEPVKPDGVHTLKIARREIVQGVAVRQRAHFEIRPGAGASPFAYEMDRDPLEIGRSSECAIQLNLVNVSRQHARIYLANDEYHLEDLGSTNGTFVNGVRVSKCVLRNNDLIEIGDAQIIFVEEKVRQ